MAKQNDENGSYVQTRSMKLDKNSNQFDIVLTIDGDRAVSLDRTNDPVVLALMFSAFAVQVASNIRQQAHKKGANLTVADMQKIAANARPKIGRQVDPIKRKDRVIRDMAKSVSVMTKEEKAELKKMLG